MKKDNHIDTLKVGNEQIKLLEPNELDNFNFKILLVDHGDYKAGSLVAVNKRKEVRVIFEPIYDMAIKIYAYSTLEFNTEKSLTSELLAVIKMLSHDNYTLWDTHFFKTKHRYLMYLAGCACTCFSDYLDDFSDVQMLVNTYKCYSAFLNRVAMLSDQEKKRLKASNKTHSTAELTKEEIEKVRKIAHNRKYQCKEIEIELDVKPNYRKYKNAILLAKIINRNSDIFKICGI